MSKNNAGSQEIILREYDDRKGIHTKAHINHICKDLVIIQGSERGKFVTILKPEEMDKLVEWWVKNRP